MRIHRAVGLGVLCVSAAGFCVWVGQAFVKAATKTPPAIENCHDRTGLHFPSVQEDAYNACLDEKAKLFIDRDYAEAKDASKAFLTLMTALFVASITFSEKIVDMQRSDWWSRGLMIACWVLLLMAITSCGAALALMMVAASYATYAPHLSYWTIEASSIYLYTASGLVFGGSLVALLVAGIISLVGRQPQGAGPGT